VGIVTETADLPKGLIVAYIMVTDMLYEVTGYVTQLYQYDTRVTYLICQPLFC